MKIATWNVNSLRVRLTHVLEWIATEKPDILALQETKLQNEAFPAEAIREAGFHAIYSGQKTYNGVAILSRLAPAEPMTDLPNLPDPQRRILTARYTGIRVLNLYVPNGQAVATDKYAYKLDWLKKITEYVVEQLRHEEPLVVLGDFNVAPDERDVHDPEQWAGHVLFSDAERRAFRTLLEAGLQDSFRLFEQPSSLFSWWDYRAAAFRRNLGLRIDHILVSQSLAKRCQRCWIDTEPRRKEKPSDHAPVIAEFDL